ncbi:MAG: hypothetical protein MUD10_04420 [Candidatus Pacebacteria bacterium]|jgi:hypothetical protein|nr:hypothetical protein [Candidatus Paceibacterota bacterium]
MKWALLVIILALLLTFAVDDGARPGPVKAPDSSTAELKIDQMVFVRDGDGWLAQKVDSDSPLSYTFLFSRFP